MSTKPERGAAPGTSPEELRQEIEKTRESLGRTVEELAAKADVKGRALHRAAALRTRARQQVDNATQTVQERVPRRGAAGGAAGTGVEGGTEEPALAGETLAGVAQAARCNATRVAAGAGGLAVAVLALRRARHRHR